MRKSEIMTKICGSSENVTRRQGGRINGDIRKTKERKGNKGSE